MQRSTGRLGPSVTQFTVSGRGFCPCCWRGPRRRRPRAPRARRTGRDPEATQRNVPVGLDIERELLPAQRQPDDEALNLAAALAPIF
jgi:hypothetical protein